MKKIILLQTALLFLFLFTNPIYSQDFDGDGIIDSLDLDDDNDGILDTEEGLVTMFVPLDALQAPDHMWKANDPTNYSNVELLFDGLNAYTGNQDLRIHSYDVTPGDLNGSILTNALIMGTVNSDVFPIGTFFTLTMENDDVSSENNPVKVTDIPIDLVTELTALGLDPNDLFQGSFTDIGPVGLDLSDFDRDGDGLIQTPGIDFSPMGTILQFFDGDPATGGTLINTSYSPIELLHSVGSVIQHTVTVTSPTTHFLVASLPDGTGKDIRVNEIQINGETNTGTLGNQMGITTIIPIDSESDGFSDHVDIDSDNDGIPDNIEGQTTLGYIPPNSVVDLLTGIDTAYGTGLSCVDTDGDNIPDFMDFDSDNDGLLDIEENGMADTILTFTDNDNDGLDNLFETNGTNDLILDVNEDIEDPTDLSILPDSDNDLFLGGDLDYRDMFDINPPAIATLDFDGIDDYVDSSFDFSGMTKASAMAWIKLDPMFASTGTIFNQGNMLLKVTGSKQILAKINSGQINSGVTPILETDKWYHVAVLFDSNLGSDKLKVYLNGKLIDSGNDASLSGAIQNGTDNFTIGKSSSANTNYFKGSIDEVRVFNTAVTQEQLHQMIHQEIENNDGNVKGKIVPKNLVDFATSTTIPWTALKVYYPMTDIVSSRTLDYSSNGKTATLYNITTLQAQTAPMPYETVANGNWSSKNTWLHGEVWDITDISKNKDWSIVHIKNDVTTSSSHTQLGMFIDNTKTLTITGDNFITNNWYLQLDGTVDLRDDSQLVQTKDSDLVTSVTGKILRRQEGNTNYYRYNYWSSPVGSLAATTLTNNNSAANNTNNNPFRLNMLKDGNGSDIQFTSAYHDTGKVSTYWLYTFQNGLTYYDWTSINQNSTIQPGFGYTQKGTGNTVDAEQEYIFDGKPNNGTILIAADDIEGDAGVTTESVPNSTMTTTLIGNPYPSALDARQFISDNAGVIQGTILLWEHWAGNSHYLSEYEGGYGYINTLTTVRGYQHTDIPIANQAQTQGVKKPTHYIPVGQGFFVEVINDGNIEFNNGQRIFKQESLGESVFMKNSSSSGKTGNKSEEETEFQLIRLEFGTSEGSTRRFVLGFGDNATNGNDYGLDGGVITELPEDDMGSLLNDKQYVIQAFSPITSDKVIDLNLNASSNYTYSLKIVELENIADDQQIYLRDNLTNIYFDLRSEEAYNFTSEEGLFANRFDIVFQTSESLSNEQFINDSAFIYVNQMEDKLFIKELNNQAKRLSITNMLGESIKTYHTVNNQTLENGISVSNLSSGIYIVSVQTENNQSIDKKIIIN